MREVGAGVVVFVHGAGLDPHLYDPVIRALDMPAVAPLRAVYESERGPVPSVEEQAADVLGRLGAWSDRLGIGGAEPVTIVGVSGGATIALAAAIALASGVEPSRPVAAIVSHEPLLGPLARELHRRVAGAAETLASHPPTASTIAAFLGRLVGTDTWRALPPERREFATLRPERVAADVAQFVAYAPSTDDIASLDARFVSTVGERSGSERTDAASVLAGVGEVHVEVVTGAGHLVQWQAPRAFATIITRMHRAARGAAA